MQEGKPKAIGNSVMVLYSTAVAIVSENGIDRTGFTTIQFPSLQINLPWRRSLD